MNPDSRLLDYLSEMPVKEVVARAGVTKEALYAWLRRRGVQLRSHGDRSVRFWAKVAKGKPDDCWEWTGRRLPAGYGCFYTDSRRVLAHRMAYELTHGRECRDGYVVMHSCDNPPCCNPDHLNEGTPSQNTLDAWRRGRLAQRRSPNPRIRPPQKWKRAG